MKTENVEIDRKVVYKPFPNCSSDQIEEGVVTSYNDKYVFVRYGNDVNSKATDPKGIEFI